MFGNNKEVLQDIIANKRHNNKIMSLDVSKKNIGIALSDYSKTIAFAYKNIIRTKLQEDLTKLLKIIVEENIFCIVIGLPLTLEGKAETRVQSIKTFASNLNKFLQENNHSIIFQFQDERYSTIFAKDFSQANAKINYSRNSKPSKNLKKTNTQNIDPKAAAWFLQNFIDYINRQI